MNSRCPTANADFLMAQRKPKHFVETSQVVHLLSSRFQGYHYPASVIPDLLLEQKCQHKD